MIKNLSINTVSNFEKENNDFLDTELFSLKFTDSLYKKDIGKFLEFLSKNFI